VTLRVCETDPSVGTDPVLGIGLVKEAKSESYWIGPPPSVIKTTMGGEILIYSGITHKSFNMKWNNFKAITVCSISTS
jgi:hypothetical protein